MSKLHGDPSGRRLHFVDLVVLMSALLCRAAANLAELACHVGNMVELTN